MILEGRSVCDKCKGNLTQANEIYEIKWTEKVEFLRGEEMEMKAEFCKYCLREFKHWIGEETR